MAQICTVLTFCVLLIAGVIRSVGAVSYNVGNSAGWDLSADLSSWIADKTFYVGDVLVFQYSSYHTLNEVDEAGYKNCTSSNALLTRSDGNTTVPLTTSGDRYFICSHEMHCLGGMKLQVLVNSPSAPAGAPQSAPQTNPSASSPEPSTDEGALPTLMFGGAHRLGVGPVLVAWLCFFTVIFV